MSEKKSFVEKLMPAVGKMQENIYVSSITGGMMNAMPVLMASAIFQLIYSFPIPAWTNFLQSIGLYGLLTTVVDVCNLTALFIVFGIGRTLGDKKGVDGVQCGLAALLCFLIITPLDVLETGTYISTSSLGAQGIFTAIIVALVAPSLYAFCIRKNIVIKMPAAVPEFVSKSFSGIPASLVTVVPFVAVRGLFSMTSWGSFTGFIYQVVQTPLTALGNSLPAHLIAIFVSCFLWWCGMHGTLVVFGACMAIWTAPMIENLNAYNAGLPIPYVLSLMSFFMIVQFLGGPGCLFGLYLNLAFATKSERYKATGKMCLVPGMFNIIEPVVYGLPIVMNPVLLAAGRVLSGLLSAGQRGHHRNSLCVPAGHVHSCTHRRFPAGRRCSPGHLLPDLPGNQLRGVLPVRQDPGCTGSEGRKGNRCTECGRIIRGVFEHCKLKKAAAAGCLYPVPAASAFLFYAFLQQGGK